MVATETVVFHKCNVRIIWITVWLERFSASCGPKLSVCNCEWIYISGKQGRCSTKTPLSNKAKDVVK